MRRGGSSACACRSTSRPKGPSLEAPAAAQIPPKCRASRSRSRPSRDEALAHELLDLRYQLERQKVLKTLPGSPAGLDLRSSSMTVELALLHEGDLLRFLADLRASGNAYYSVRHCTITRVGPAPSIASIAPRLRGTCQIDLITLSEGKVGR